jgi:Fur-regulated basic protein A
MNRIGGIKMENLLRAAVRQRKQYLIEELLKKGVYKKENHHLFELTLSDLEKEYQTRSK